MRTGTGGRYSNATDGTWCVYANVSPCRTACSRTRWPTGVTITVAMAGLLALGAGGAYALRRRTVQSAE